MNHNTNSLDNQYLLNTPLAYALQDKTLQEIEAIKDENGWNVLHWAVATANIPKVKELIHFAFDREITSKSNLIPRQVYIDKKKPEEIKKPVKIAFCNKGFTPAHLAMFLYNHYRFINDFFFEGITEKYQTILSLLVEGEWETKCADNDQFSLFDYAFLLEDPKSIEILHMRDPEFKTLNKVTTRTAKAILETMEIKFGKCGTEHIIDALTIIILKRDIEEELPCKKNVNKAIQKI